MPICNVSLTNESGKFEQLVTVKELDIIYHPAARCYLHPRINCSVDALGYVNLWRSALPGDDGNPQILQPSSSGRAPFKNLAGDDGATTIRRGKDAAGAVSASRSTLRGSNLYLPSGGWYLAVLGKLDLPSNISIQWATDDPAAASGIGVATTSTGMIRFFTQIYGTQTMRPSADAVNDGARALWEFTYDGSQVVCQKNRTTYLTVTTALPSLTGAQRLLRFGSGRAATNDDTSPLNQSAGEDDFYLTADSSLIDTVFLAAVKARCLELHPSMTIA